MQASMAQSDARPTGDQDIAGSIPTGSDNNFSLRLIMNYFLDWTWNIFLIDREIFSKVIYSLPLIKKAGQFLVKEYAQVLDKAWPEKSVVR